MIAENLLGFYGKLNAARRADELGIIASFPESASLDET